MRRGSVNPFVSALREVTGRVMETGEVLETGTSAALRSAQYAAEGVPFLSARPKCSLKLLQYLAEGLDILSEGGQVACA
jgi:hypothetical protein